MFPLSVTFRERDQFREDLSSNISVHTVTHSHQPEGRKLTGVPNPVTGSQPFVTGKPVTPQPWELPLRISVKPLYPLEYNHGFMNPRGGLPDPIRASLTSEMTLDMSGQEALVPEMEDSVPFHTKAK